MYEPRDPIPYPPDPRSQPIVLGMANGTYVFAVSENRQIYVLPDGPHLHPKIFGNAQPVHYAGDLTVQGDTIVDITNLTGTFNCGDPQGLLEVADLLRELGFQLPDNAVKFFPPDGSRPRVLE